MSNIDLHEFNVLSRQHNYFMTKNRYNGFPTLKDSSIFLQKILSNHVSNSVEKKISKIRSIKNNNQIKLNKYFNLRTYQSPIATHNNDNNSINLMTNNIKRKNMVISPDRKNNLNIISANKINTPNYSKIPIDINKRMAKSPNLGKTFNINNDYYSDYKVLNYNGKKIFATESFNGFNSLTKNNSPEENDNNKKESELFRNYKELMKKKDEIYKRKIKQDSSFYRRQILKTEKDKEIKEQTISKDKLKVIPFKKKMRISSNDNITINNVKKNKNNKTINNMNYNIIMLQQSRNFYNNKSFKTNNIFISKNLKMNKSMTNLGTPENIKINSIFNNNFNQILYSNDKKICIRLHVLKCKNIFIFNTKNYKKCLKIQKVMSINYRVGKRNQNKKFVKRIKNMDLLSSIKEEEEKSKLEKINKDIINKKEVNEKINIDNDLLKKEGIEQIGVRSKYLSRFRKK